jgi:hypothetical protein
MSFGIMMSAAGTGAAGLTNDTSTVGVSDTSGGFRVRPIRSVSSLSANQYPLAYDATTYEVVYVSVLP